MTHGVTVLKVILETKKFSDCLELPVSFMNFLKFYLAKNILSTWLVGPEVMHVMCM